MGGVLITICYQEGTRSGKSPANGLLELRSLLNIEMLMLQLISGLVRPCFFEKRELNVGFHAFFV